MAERSEYPSTPVSTASVNKISNGNFEYAAKGKTNSGWKFDRRVINSEDVAYLRSEISAQNPGLSAEKINELVNEARKNLQAVPADEMCTVEKELGYMDSCGLKVERRGLINQTVDSVYGGFETELALQAKGKGTVSLLYMGYGDDVVEEKIIRIDSEEWTTINQTFVAPQGTKRLRIQFYTQLGSELYADNVNLRIN